MKMKKQIKGQTMIEYIILVALLAALSIPIVTMLGNVFRDRMINVADEMVDGNAHVENQGTQMVKDAQKKVRRRINDFNR